MASEHIHLHTRAHQESLHEPALFTLLANSLVLHQTVPYLPISSLLNLASTSRSFHSLVHQSHGVFRHLDLTTVKRAQLCVDNSTASATRHQATNVRHDRFVAEATENEVYSGPLRGVLTTLRHRDILRNVQTLVLDGLSVTAEFLNDMLVDPSFPVRILSVRDCANLNEAKLMQTLRFAYRRGRADSPMLRGFISIAWNRKSHTALSHAIAMGEGDDWYHKHGRIISKKITDGWAETLLDCRDSLRFDAVLCTGPRHQNSPAFGRVPVSSYSSQGRATPWAVATFAVGGCAVCGTAPEGFTVHGESPEEQLPLLAPLLVHSSNVKTACRPGGASSEGGQPRFVPRCLECIRERYCFSCDQWWCESCYQQPLHARKIQRSCWECDPNCDDCVTHTSRTCKSCGGGYCLVHYDGATETHCDWCSSRRGSR
ncbi:hypothetical protein Micbo1qcDRAFT_149727 [Microdochium bolleyi]|uniref:F-box domain-containing protein n=1 Tax=Microdochium bolleyi TaxID=196109 RepID=A0A136IY67_9PEZI|nr:hypothetical protein Micbo1qcDRAFT_149727 [Microdochium bolleyi]